MPATVVVETPWQIERNLGPAAEARFLGMITERQLDVIELGLDYSASHDVLVKLTEIASQEAMNQMAVMDLKWIVADYRSDPCYLYDLTERHDTVADYLLSLVFIFMGVDDDAIIAEEPDVVRYIGSLGPGAASEGDPPLVGAPRLYRFGLEPESAESVEQQSEAAVKQGLPHWCLSGADLAVLMLPPGLPMKSPSFSQVVKTGRPGHYTIVLPHPVTTEDAELFNILFGRGATP